MIYYAEYYALYSFLQKIGIKCENHFCSILATKYHLGDDKTKIIESHKSRRIDAQYYMRIADKDLIESMLNDAKIFISDFDNIVSGLSVNDIAEKRKQLMAHIT